MAAKHKHGFKSYVTRDAVNAVLAGFKPPRASSQILVEFVLLLLRGEPFETFCNLVQRAESLSRAHNGLIEILAGPVMVITFGAIPDPGTDHGRNRRGLAQSLALDLGTDSAILHGKEPAFVGDYGGEMRSTFGSFFPRYSDMLRHLLRMPLGAVAEWVTDAAAK